MREQLTDSIWITDVAESDKVVESVRRPFFYDITFEIRLPEDKVLTITKTVDCQSPGYQRLLSQSEAENRAMELLLQDLYQRGEHPRERKIFSELADDLLAPM